jgi:hypothetical protein
MEMAKSFTVLPERLELSNLLALDPKSSVSTNSTTGAVPAEDVGFEPTGPFQVHWFSRPARSTTLPILLNFYAKMSMNICSKF